MSNLHIGFITSDSHKSTCRKSIREGDYNQFRAHGLSVIDITRGITNNICDIGEVKSKRPELELDKELDDDLGIHFNSRRRWNQSVIQYSEASFEEFLSIPGTHVIFMLYMYVTDDNREYLRKYLTDPRLDGIVYYASDDEMYYKGYFLEGLLRDYYGKSEGLDLYMKIKDKLIAILSGHNYCKSYFELCPYCIHLPMYPNSDYKDDIIDTHSEINMQYDFFLNCFHDSRMLNRILTRLNNHSFLIVTNDTIGQYIDESILPAGSKIEIFRGRNIPLRTLVKLIRQCRYYYLPNTYVHIDKWYETHYHQDIMYTHKYLEAYYANRLVMGGDMTDEIMDMINKVTFRFHSRQYIYEDADPMDSTILKVDASYSVVKKIGQISKYILSWLRNKNPKAQSS